MPLQRWGGLSVPPLSFWVRLTHVPLPRDEPEHPGRVVQATHQILRKDEPAKEEGKGGQLAARLDSRREKEGYYGMGLT